MIVIGVTVLIAVAVIIGMDIFLAATKGSSATLSWFMYSNAQKYPIIAAAVGFIFGLLMAHFWWTQVC